jgi:hypothetical protein
MLLCDILCVIQGKFERHGFKLSWNGTGKQPKVLSWEFRDKTPAERDQWVNFIKEITGKNIKKVQDIYEL